MKYDRSRAERIAKVIADNMNKRKRRDYKEREALQAELWMVFSKQKEIRKFALWRKKIAFFIEAKVWRRRTKMIPRPPHLGLGGTDLSGLKIS